MKFCFFGNISGALKGKTPGGGELQISLLARALALKGHDVVIIDPNAQENFITDEGVKLTNIPHWNKGWRGIRLFMFRIPALWKILKEQQADFYYVRMRAYLHIIPYIIAKKTKGKFIQAIASDLDVLSFKKKFNYQYKAKFNLFTFLTDQLPSDIVNNYLLKKADYIVLQHSGQKHQLGSEIGKNVLFPNIIDDNNVHINNNSLRNYFIYVGSLSILKGSGNLYELIKIIEKKNTVVIVGQPADQQSKIIFEKLRTMQNVVIKGRLNHNETLRLIANAKALINTSYYEGFPNVFLEAWALETPVISLWVNPGNVIDNYNLGKYCKGDLNAMKKCIDLDLTGNIDKRQLISYIHEFHSFNNAGERFLNLLNNKSSLPAKMVYQ